MIKYRVTFHRYAHSEHFQSHELLSNDELLRHAQLIYKHDTVSDFTIFIENQKHDVIALQGDIHRDHAGGDLIFSALS